MLYETFSKQYVHHQQLSFSSELNNYLSISPVLVVVAGDRCSRGREFESMCRILNGSFYPYICCKHCINV